MSDKVIKNTNPFEIGPVEMREQLSAMMDGELSRDQVRFLLRSVEIESDLAQRWSSYHVVSATLKREFVAVPLRADFSSAVLAQLGVDSAATSMPRAYAALRWVGGGAIAAAVAVVALVVSRPIDNAAPGAASTALVAQAVPQAQPVRHQAPVYLPLAPSPAPLTGFDANRVMQASFDTVMPNLYAPNGQLLSRNSLSNDATPYVFYVNPLVQRQLFPQQGAPPDAHQNDPQQH